MSTGADVTTINRATWTDDDGSGATGTIINNARLQGDVYDKIDQALATLDAKDASQDTSITANGPHKILSANHTDVVPATLVTGDLLAADATGKLARLPAGANGSLLGMAAGLPAWQVPTAGIWTPIPYVAGNFTASGSMVWTVEAADQSLFQYTRIGSLLLLTFSFASTTLAGTASANLMVQLPFTPAAGMGGLGRVLLAGVGSPIWIFTLAGDSKLYIQKIDATAFPVSGTNNVSVQGTLITG
jgi:hypothetical protein